MRIYIEKVEGGYGWRRVDGTLEGEHTIDQSTGPFVTVRAASAAVLNMFPEDEVHEILESDE